MDIDNMPAGNYMNELIAEHAFKMKHYMGDEVPEENRHYMPRDDEIQEVWKNSTVCYCMICDSLPNWSGDIELVYTLIDKFKVSLINSEDGWYAVVTEDIIHSRGYIPKKSKEVYGRYWALADTIPLAVCRVILKSVMD